MTDEYVRCEKEGCREEAIDCYLPGEDEPSEYLCTEHAQESGYCYLCGIFCAGYDDFHYGRHRGLCDVCADELDADCPPDEEPDPDCDDCGGEGWVADDCGEDTCCCANPELDHDIVPCRSCRRRRQNQ